MDVSHNVTTGKVTLLIYSGSNNIVVSDSGPIVEVEFSVASGASGSSYLNLGTCLVVDEGGNSLDVNKSNGTFTISGIGRKVKLNVVNDIGSLQNTDNKVFISLTNDVNVSGVQLDLYYDASKLTISGVNKTLRTTHMDVIHNISSGKVVILIYSGSGNIISPGMGAIIEVEFDVASGVSGSSSFTLETSLVADGTGNSLSVNKFDIYMASPGDMINLPIIIPDQSPSDGINSFEYKIIFDTSLVELIGFETTGLLADGFSIESNFTHDDTFKIAGARAEPLLGSGTFMKLKFAVKPSAGALDTAFIEIKNFIFNDGTPLDVIPNGRTAIITFGLLYGDVSLNAEISSYDASLVLQFAVAKITLNDTAQIAADVSGNGIILAFDAGLILRYEAGFITNFPIGNVFAYPKEVNKNSIAFITKNFENNEFVEYSINLKNIKNVYSSEIALEFSSLELKACKKTDITSNYLLEENIKNGVLKIAFAGYEPINNDGKMVKLKFRKLSDEGIIRLNSVIVNEVEINVINDISKLLPATYGLSQNYPNPFNSETIIKYQLPEASKVEISIYNILGQRVRTLVFTHKEAGYYHVKWNGKNNSGETVASGIYVVKMEAVNYFNARKIIYLR